MARHRRTWTLGDVRRITHKKRDAWWTVVLVDPVATPLVRLTATRTRITPNQVTWGALILGLGAAACFLPGDRLWLAAGALLYHVSFILDCIDGKLARLKGNGTVFGAWLDYVFDRIRVACCAVTLSVGQYLQHDNPWYLLLGLTVVFLDMLRYVNALQIFKIRTTMRKKIEEAKADNTPKEQQDGDLVFIEDILRENPDFDTRQVEARPEVVDLHKRFRNRFPWYTRCRNFLLRHRIRTHLISGIEFQMAVFIVGPLIGQVMITTIAAAAGLFAFELAIIYKLLLSTRDFGRTLDRLKQPPALTAAAEPLALPPAADAPEPPAAPAVHPPHEAHQAYPAHPAAHPPPRAPDDTAQLQRPYLGAAFDQAPGLPVRLPPS